jgi:hypothetical protein
LNPDTLTRNRPPPGKPAAKQNRGGGRKPTLGKVRLVQHLEARNNRVAFAISRDIVDRAGLRDVTELGIGIFQADGRTRLRIAPGEGFRFADPGKPLRHIRIAIERLTEFFGFEFPRNFPPIDLEHRVEVGKALHLFLPTVADMKRIMRKVA